MWQKVKCFFGRHAWFHSFYAGRGGVILGKRCPHCKVWHKNAKGFVIGDKPMTKWHNI